METPARVPLLSRLTDIAKLSSSFNARMWGQPRFPHTQMYPPLTRAGVNVGADRHAVSFEVRPRYRHPVPKRLVLRGSAPNQLGNQVRKRARVPIPERSSPCMCVLPVQGSYYYAVKPLY